MSPFAWVVFHRSATPCDPAYAKSGQNARRPRSIVIVGAPVGIHITEIIAIVVIGGAEPPPHGGSRCGMSVRNLGVACFEVVILCLDVLLVRARIGTRALDLELR